MTTIQAGPLLASLVQLEEGTSVPSGPGLYLPLVLAALGFLLALLLDRREG